MWLSPHPLRRILRMIYIVASGSSSLSLNVTFNARNSMEFYFRRSTTFLYPARAKVIESLREIPCTTWQPPSRPVQRHLGRNIFNVRETIFRGIRRPCPEIEKYSRISCIPLKNLLETDIQRRRTFPTDSAIRVQSARTGISMRDRTRR